MESEVKEGIEDRVAGADADDEGIASNPPPTPFVPDIRTPLVRRSTFLRSDRPRLRCFRSKTPFTAVDDDDEDDDEEDEDDNDGEPTSCAGASTATSSIHCWVGDCDSVRVALMPFTLAFPERERDTVLLLLLLSITLDEADGGWRESIRGGKAEWEEEEVMVCLPAGEAGGGPSTGTCFRDDWFMHERTWQDLMNRVQVIQIAEMT